MTKPLIVIVDPTASGKSALALDLAEEFAGEIICADSRTVYKEMDIGTAKPSAEDRKRIPHHLLDVVNPDEKFSAAQFKKLAIRAIDDITRRKKLPIMVGGSGLYIDSVLFNYSFSNPSKPYVRAELEQMDIPALQHRIVQRGLELPENYKNKRYLIRTLERGAELASKGEMREDTLVIGVNPEREILRDRIEKRRLQMIEQGLPDEMQRLTLIYGRRTPGLEALGYRDYHEYMEGHSTLEQFVALMAKQDLALAKRQQTWFKRNKSIQWLHNRDNYKEAVEFITSFLHK